MGVATHLLGALWTFWQEQEGAQEAFWGEYEELGCLWTSQAVYLEHSMKA